MSSIADKPKRSFNPASAAHRRRFFIERALRLQSRGTGSNMDRLMEDPVQNVKDMPLLEGLPVMLIGAHAAAAYAPPRNTADVDFIVSFDRYAEAEARMLAGRLGKDQRYGLPEQPSGTHRRCLGKAWRRRKRHQDQRTGLAQGSILRSGRPEKGRQTRHSTRIPDPHEDGQRTRTRYWRPDANPRTHGRLRSGKDDFSRKPLPR